MRDTRNAPHLLFPGVSRSHAGYVEYLRECAGRWAREPNGADQAARVAADADRVAALGPADCGVCVVWGAGAT